MTGTEKGKRIAVVAVMLVIALVSAFVVSKTAGSAETYKSVIESLDEKKVTVTGLTAASAAASALLALVPGDATTPIANQIANIGSYLLIVVCALILEKLLLTVFGYAVTVVIIPLACALCAAGAAFSRRSLYAVAAKVFIFGMALLFVIPLSVHIGDMVYDTHRSSIEQTIEDADTKTDNADGKDSKNENKLFKAFSGAESKISEWGDKAKEQLSDFVDAVAVLIITSCVIPVGVIWFVFWLVRVMFAAVVGGQRKNGSSGL